jgi:hypothetical protein
MESVFKFNIDGQCARAKLPSMRNNRAAVLWLTVSILAVLIITAVIIRWSAPPPPPAALPNPNGYFVFLQADDNLQKNTSDFRTMNEDDLRTLVEENTNGLRIARTGFSEKVQVPIDYSDPEKNLPHLAKIKTVVLAFLAEGRLAEMEHRPCDAARSYLDAIHLGVECRRGGTIIDGLVGIGCEAMGTSELQKLLGNLDGQCCRKVALELEALDAQKPTWDDTLQEERYWSHRAFPGLQYRLVELFAWNSTRVAKAKAAQRFKSQQMRTRKLLIEIASRAYELDNGHRPASISDLTPTYLKTIPVDPSTGTNFTYLP